MQLSLLQDTFERSFVCHTCKRYQAGPQTKSPPKSAYLKASILLAYRTVPRDHCRDCIPSSQLSLSALRHIDVRNTLQSLHSKQRTLHRPSSIDRQHSGVNRIARLSNKARKVQLSRKSICGFALAFGIGPT